MLIPFDKKSDNMLDYTWGAIGEETATVAWKENYEFNDTLEFTHFTRGRSSVKAHFKSFTDGKLYEMFLTDFEKVVLSGKLDHAELSGFFTFCKRGANYGIKMI